MKLNNFSQNLKILSKIGERFQMKMQEKFIKIY